MIAFLFTVSIQVYCTKRAVYPPVLTHPVYANCTGVRSTSDLFNTALLCGSMSLSRFGPPPMPKYEEGVRCVIVMFCLTTISFFVGLHKLFFRWKRERAAIRKKPEAWAALHIASSNGGSSSSRAPSGCGNASFSDNGDGSLTSSGTRHKAPCDPFQRHTRSCGHPRSDNQTPPSSRRTPQSPVLLEGDESPLQRRDPSGHTETEQVHSVALPQTAPCYVLCGSITDAETGEPLELRRRRWEFPPTSRCASTAEGSTGGGVFGGGSGPSCRGSSPKGES